MSESNNTGLSDAEIKQATSDVLGAAADALEASSNSKTSAMGKLLNSSLSTTNAADSLSTFNGDAAGKLIAGALVTAGVGLLISGPAVAAALLALAGPGLAAGIAIAAIAAAVTYGLNHLNNQLADELFDLFQIALNKISPLALDLDGDGIESIALENSSVYFDLDGDGIAEKTGWIGPNDAFLAIDSDNDGYIEDIDELFGNGTVDGFTELSQLDSNSDGVIDANDDQFDDLLVWQDLDQDGFSDADELRTLDQAEIASIDLTNEEVDFEVEGNTISNISTFSWSDGSLNEIVDIWFAVRQHDTASLPYEGTLDWRAFILPTIRGAGDMPSLLFAMSADETLLNSVKDLTYSTVSEVGSYHSQIESILYRWAGVETIDPASRGQNVDAQHLAVLEAYLAADFVQYGGPDPFTRAGSALETAWDTLYYEVAARLLIQGPLESIFESVLHDPQTGEFIGDLNATAAISKMEDLAPDNATNLARFWDLMVSTIDIVAEDLSVATSSYETELSTAIQNSGASFTLEEIRDGKVELGLDDEILATGEVGNDTYSFSLDDGVLRIEDVDTGGTGTDTIDFGAGIDTDDLIFLRSGKTSDDLVIRIRNTSDEVIVSDQFLNDDYGIEEIEFDNGTIWTLANIEPLLLNSTTGNDELFGYDGSDDTLDGGTGDDYLEGRTGDDTYIYDSGYGDDIIFDDDEGGGDNDVVDLAAGIAPSDVAVSRRGGDSNDLVLTLTATGATLLVQDQFDGADFGIESVEFDDGTVWNELTLETKAQEETSGDDQLIGFETADTLEGGAGDDYIETRGGNDTLDGEAGDDELRGGEGDDTYHFDTGYDSDLILDDGDAADVDKVVFGTGIATSDLVVRRSPADTDDLIIEVTGTDDKLTINEYYGSTKHQIESFEFDDGTIWTRTTVDNLVFSNTTGDDQIFGFDGADTLDGGLGDDKLQGEEGNDTYVFDSGYGEDTILDSGDAADVDKVEFGSGIVVADVSLTRNSNDPDDLVIDFAGSSDQLIINEHFGNQKHWIETLEFDDGTVWNRATIDSMVVGSTAGDDNLYGFDSVDSLDGGQGNDYIEGRGGNDTLQGGLGNDELRGGEGDDTYNFDSGDGEDVILDNGDAADLDKVVFGAGIAVADVSLTRSVSDSDDLVITFTGSSDELIINEHFGNQKHWIETLEFDDGTTWDRATIDNAVLGSSSGDDNLIGFDVAETIEGGAGNDNIEGLGGDDVLDGGVGNDDLQGDEGNDTYIFNSGYGEDVILDSGNSIDVDKIVLGPGIAPGDLTLSRPTNDRDDVVITFAGSSDELTINEHYGSQTHWIEFIEFDDGTIWDRSDVDREVLGSTDGNDNIFGFDTTDILDGGLGNDKLQGEPGDDVYHFDLGYGDDVVLDSGTADDVDTVVFGPGISPDDLALRRRSSDIDDVVIEVVGASDELQINEFYGNQIHWVELFIFDDGTIWDRTDISDLVLVGTDGNDDIFGFDGDDVMDGGLGNDDLKGFDGSDTYVFGLGYGSDEIRDEGDASDVDMVKFLDGIDPEDLLVRRRISDNGDDVVISVVGENDQLVIQEQYGSNSARYGITNFEFANGTVWNTTNIDILVITETDDNDNLIGFDVAENLNGGLGNDYIEARGGNDVLDGGLGNDELRGEDGDDTYNFDIGDGRDTIRDDGSASDVNKLVFGAGVDPNEVLLSLRSSDDDDLIIEFLNSDDRVLIEEQFGNNASENQMTTIEFGTGTVWNLAFLNELANTPQIVGTSGNDTIDKSSETERHIIYGLDGDDTLDGGSGGDDLLGGGGEDELNGNDGTDVLIGGADNDTLSGGDGTDTLNGQAGADDLNGGNGADTFIFETNTGDDTIEDFQTGSDLIDVTAFTAFTSGQGVLDATADSGGNAVVTLTGSDSITLEGVTKSSLSTSNFITAPASSLAALSVSSANGMRSEDLMASMRSDDLMAASHSLEGRSGTVIDFAGTDTFAFKSGLGSFDISNFEAGDDSDDLLDLSDAGLMDFSEVLAATTQQGSDVVINLTGDDSLILVGVDKDDLKDSDFQYAA